MPCSLLTALLPEGDSICSSRPDFWAAIDNAQCRAATAPCTQELMTGAQLIRSWTGAVVAVLRLPNTSWYWKFLLIPAKLAAVLGYQEGKRGGIQPVVAVDSFDEKARSHIHAPPGR